MWKRCKICSTPGAREFVDGQLDNLQELRVISAKLALQNIFIDKSSIHRHSKRCYSIRARAERKRAELHRAEAEGVLVVLWPGDPEPTIGPHDVLVTVEFEMRPMRNPQPPQALEEISPAEKTVPEGKKASLIDKLRNLLHRKTEAPSPPEPPAPQPCQHKTMRETPGGPRCEDCGWQPKAFTPVGAQSRKDYFAGHGRGRLGRF